MVVEVLTALLCVAVVYLLARWLFNEFVLWLEKPTEEKKPKEKKPKVTQPTEVTRIIVRGDTPQQQVFKQEDFARMIRWWK